MIWKKATEEVPPVGVEVIVFRQREYFIATYDTANPYSYSFDDKGPCFVVTDNGNSYIDSGGYVPIDEHTFWQPLPKSPYE